MAGFSALDKRMKRDVNQIHDFLWHEGETIDGAKLLANLRREAQELDAFLGAGGKLRRNADTLVKATEADKEEYGGTLYELLYNTYNLAAASERIRRKDYRGAAEHASLVAESDSIGTCVALDSFPLVEAWEGGKIDFDEYASKLADALQAKGVSQAGQYKRLLLAIQTFKEWDPSSPREAQALAARAAVEAAAWCPVAARAIRQEVTGRQPRVPLADYSAVVQKIVGRL